MKLALLLVGLALTVPHAAGQKPGFVGTEGCNACHEDFGKALLKTRHGLLNKEQSCELCHGPGEKHVDAAEAKFILNHAKAKPKEADASCLSCHKNQATHAGRISGSHARGDVACVSCHSIHAAPKAKTTNDLCKTCHLDSWAQFQRPHAHAVNQGVMTCVDCHNPHGTNRSAAFKSTARTHNNEPGCLKCHADKRGPFAFEHAPVRLEGCNSCHEPHGSANPRMLNRAEIANHCLECHSNLPARTNATGTLGTIATSFHDLRLPVYRNCTTCHVKIHGSHANRDFLR